ncbi:hypothetical protein BD769DRAFT_1397495 [Suillus cothurnatus]|nr:hypothetical protein BD769DRAFT_1397495 [Suillus cothurnatus]
MSYSQSRCYSNDSHTSDHDPFDGLRSLDDVSGECTPGAGHLGYRDTSSSDVERAIKLAEKFEEERYQQLKRDVDGWNARVGDDTNILPLLKRKRPCSDSGGTQASPCRFGHNLTNSPRRVPSMNPTTPRKRRKLQAPFEFNSHPSKTLVEALSGIEMALERHNAILSRMCQAMENFNTKLNSVKGIVGNPQGCLASILYLETIGELASQRTLNWGFNAAISLQNQIQLARHNKGEPNVEAGKPLLPLPPSTPVLFPNVNANTTNPSCIPTPTSNLVSSSSQSTGPPTTPIPQASTNMSAMITAFTKLSPTKLASIHAIMNPMLSTGTSISNNTASTSINSTASSSSIPNTASSTTNNNTLLFDVNSERISASSTAETYSIHTYIVELAKYHQHIPLSILTTKITAPILTFDIEQCTTYVADPQALDTAKEECLKEIKEAREAASKSHCFEPYPPRDSGHTYPSCSSTTTPSGVTPHSKAVNKQLTCHSTPTVKYCVDFNIYCNRKQDSWEEMFEHTTETGGELPEQDAVGPVIDSEVPTRPSAAPLTAAPPAAPPAVPGPQSISATMQGLALAEDSHQDPPPAVQLVLDEDKLEPPAVQKPKPKPKQKGKAVNDTNTTTSADPEDQAPGKEPEALFTRQIQDQLTLLTVAGKTTVRFLPSTSVSLSCSIPPSVATYFCSSRLFMICQCVGDGGGLTGGQYPLTMVGLVEQSRYPLE